MNNCNCSWSFPLSKYFNAKCFIQTSLFNSINSSQVRYYNNNFCISEHKEVKYFSKVIQPKSGEWRLEFKTYSRGHGLKHQKNNIDLNTVLEVVFPWWLRLLSQEDSLEEEMATHSSILNWRIPMDRGDWWVSVHGIAKSQTQLGD